MSAVKMKKVLAALLKYKQAVTKDVLSDIVLGAVDDIIKLPLADNQPMSPLYSCNEMKATGAFWTSELAVRDLAANISARMLFWIASSENVSSADFPTALLHEALAATNKVEEEVTKYVMPILLQKYGAGQCNEQKVQELVLRASLAMQSVAQAQQMDEASSIPAEMCSSKLN